MLSHLLTEAVVCYADDWRSVITVIVHHGVDRELMVSW